MISFAFPRAFTTKVGGRKPLRVQLFADLAGTTPLDLSASGVLVTCGIGRCDRDVLVQSGDCTIIDGPQGIVEFGFPDGAPARGEYRADFRVDGLDAAPIYSPDDGYVRVIVSTAFAAGV